MEGQTTASRRRTFVVLVFILLVIIGAAYYWRSSKPSIPEQRTRITIAQVGDFFLYAPLYIGIDEGFFAKQGLDVNLISTGGDEKTWAAVVSGNASFGVADPTFVAISDARGQPGRVIASIVNGVPFWGVTFDQKMQPLKNPAELRGHTVATFPAPSTAYTLQKRMFMDGKLPVSIREGGFGTIVTMLRAGQADIGLELEPNVSQSVAGGARIVYSMKEVYGDFAITGLTATPDLLTQKPELARKVVCGLQSALDFIRRDRDAALAHLVRRFPEIKPEIAKAALDRVLAENIVPESPRISADAWKKAISLRVEVGDIQNPKEMQTYVDNQFADWATQNCRLK